MSARTQIPAPPNSRSRAIRSTIAIKQAMALTGLAFIGYVVLHLYGNLKLYQGAGAFDRYAHFMRTLGEPVLPYGGFLAVARTTLVLSLVVHVWAAIYLARRASRARTVKYAAKVKNHSTISSRAMRWGGLTLFAYLVFHIANLTTHSIHTYAPTNSPYARVVDSFQPENWWVVVIYLTAQVPLGMHLHHGFFSSLQTLGVLRNGRQITVARRTGLTLAIVVCAGFCSLPIAVLTGVVS